jgi:hypothetical protein
MEGEDYYLHLYDTKNRLIAIAPASIAFLYPTKDREKTFIFFWGDNPPRTFNHSIYEIVEALDTFYNANE